MIAERFKPLWGVIGAGRPGTTKIMIAIILAACELAMTLLAPLVVKNLIDSLSVDRDVIASIVDNANLQILIGLLVAGAVFEAASRYLLSISGLEMAANLRRKLSRHLVAMPVAYFDEDQAGTHTSLVVNDTKMLGQFVTDGLFNFVSGVFLLIGSGVMLFLLDARLASTLILIIFLAFVAITPVTSKMSKIGAGMSASAAGLTAALTRTFGEIRLVKAFTAENMEGRIHAREIGNVLDFGRQAARVQSVLQPFVTLALSVSLLTIFLYGGARVAAGVLSIGTLTAFILYIFNITVPMFQLALFMAELQKAKGASLRMFDLMGRQPEVIDDHPGIAQIEDGTRGVEPRCMTPKALRNAADLTFSNVEFSYGGLLRHPIRIPHLQIVGGRCTAIVGPSGAGKTTIASLIQRFYEPEAGIIAYGGHAISDLDLHGWRSRIGYVAQSSPMLDGSIRDNICYGISRPVSPDELEQAAEAANCLDFVRATEAGFDTAIGESGVRLSGGQRQRLAIARAFLREPEILLLDEPTSNLDGDSEIAVMKALGAIMANRTTIIITHRLSTQDHAHAVLKVHDGQVTVTRA